jgi:hypothetical protein
MFGGGGGIHISMNVTKNIDGRKEPPEIANNYAM